MIKSSLVRKILRTLITLLGVGTGAALMLILLQLHRWLQPDATLPVGVIVFGYLGAMVVFGLVGFLLSNWLIEQCIRLTAAMEGHMDRMPFNQALACTIGLTVGLVIAYLVSQMISLLGSGVFTTAFSAIIYVLLGVVGWSVGWKRGKEIGHYFTRLGERWDKRGARIRTADNAARPKVLDSSALIDGRILEIAATGFIEGELVVPGFVLNELHRIADATDGQKRMRGRRGLDIVKALQERAGVTLRVEDTDFSDAPDADVKLLRLCTQLSGTVITCDYNLAKVAAVAGIPLLNLNALAEAMRTRIAQGDILHVLIAKEGREPGQGVAYSEDGTMIVIDGGRQLIGQEAAVTVTSILQTSAGRMIFAKL